MSITDTSTDDQNSLNMIRQGGKMMDQGMAKLYKKYAAQFFKHYRYHGLSKEQAEDVVQMTFMKITRSCDTFKGDSPLAAWLWAIARNCMTDHIRQTKSHPTVDLGEEGWEALEATSEGMRTYDPLPAGETLEDCVTRGFTEFAKHFAERAHAISLVMEGYDTNYIAQTLQRTPGATREFLSQSRKKIEDFLRPCREYLVTA